MGLFSDVFLQTVEGVIMSGRAPSIVIRGLNTAAEVVPKAKNLSVAIKEGNNADIATNAKDIFDIYTKDPINWLERTEKSWL